MTNNMNTQIKHLYSALILGITLFCSLSLAQAPSMGKTTIESPILQPQTPAGFQKGTPPLGSFGGSNFDQVNLFNGNVAITMPLASLTGRAGMRGSVVLSYNSKLWHIEKQKDDFSDGSQFVYVPVYSDYDPDIPVIAPGWTLHTGRLRVRQTATGQAPGCLFADNKTKKPLKTLTTITFTSPDGTEYDFVDSLYDGEPKEIDPANNCEPISRGNTFHSIDATSATFVSNTPIIDTATPGSALPLSGTIYLKDGTRFVIVNGLVSRQIDRNGNQVKYEYQDNILIGIVDTLGEERKITLDYTSNNKGDLVRLTVTSKGISQPNGSSPDRVTTVNLTALKNVLRADQPAGIPTYDQLFPDDLIQKAISFGTFNPRVISSIELPSGHKWEFKYNVYGEIAYVKTPSLGAIEYDYGPNASDPDSPGGFDRSRLQIFRRVQERRTYPNSSSGQIEGRTTYDDPKKDYTNGIANIREKHFNAIGDRLAESKHQYWGIPETTGTGTFGYQDWRTGKEVTTVEIDPARGPLRETDYEFHNRDGRNWPSLQSIDKDLHPQNDPVLTKTTSKLLDTNETATVEHVYDQYNNIRREIANGFDGQPIRETDRDFIDSATYTSAPIDNTLTNRKPHIRNLVSAETIKGKEGIETTTIFDYDNYSLVTPVGANTANIQATQANGYDSNYNLRGNLTQITAGTNSSDPTDKPNVQSQYDIFGNVVQVSGPITNQVVTTEYDPTFFFAYPTKTQQTVRGGSSDNQLLQVQRNYDYYTGALLKSIGFNGEEIRYEYVDPLDRVTKEIRPANFGETDYTYSNPGAFPAEVKVENTIQGTQKFVSFNRYDGLLRTVEQERVESAGNVIAKNEYDGLGRTSKVTNPSRGNGAATDGFTTTTYDGLSRVLTVTTTGSEGNTGIVTRSYQGSKVTVTDQTGKQRKSQTDALGRLITVFEPTPSGALTQNTDYDYDARGNLKHVHQGIQTRTFTYDALSRLRTANAPESGITTYTYDVASNLQTRTDARGVITNYDYDSLNRIIKKAYNDLTPDVEYFYDRMPINLPLEVTAPANYTPGFGLGRLVATASPRTIRQKATAQFYHYDIGGRTEQSQELVADNYFPFTMQYNEGSLPISWTTPTQVITNYSYNNSAEVTSVLRNSLPLSSNIQYTASGSVTQQTLGNGLLHSINYNSRLQPTIISLGNSLNSHNILQLQYNYGLQDSTTINNPNSTLDNTKNNGNIGRILISHNPYIDPLEQDFTYDELNRLKIAKEFAVDQSLPVCVPPPPCLIPTTIISSHTSPISAAPGPFLSLYDSMHGENSDAFTIDLTDPSLTTHHPFLQVGAVLQGDYVVDGTYKATLNGSIIMNVHYTNPDPNSRGFEKSENILIDLSGYLGQVITITEERTLNVLQPLPNLGQYMGGFASASCEKPDLSDFSINFTPSGFDNVTAGSTLTTNIMETAINGYSAPVSIAITDASPQLFASLNTNQLDPQQPATLTIQTTSNIPSGIYNVNLRAIGYVNNCFRAFTFSVRVSVGDGGNGGGGGGGGGSSAITNKQTESATKSARPLINGVITNSSIKSQPNQQLYHNNITPLKSSSLNPNNYSKTTLNDINPLVDPTVSWRQTYDYDQYGNRTNVNDLTGDHPLAINPNNNQITSSMGIIYDLAGNVTTDINGHTYDYDAENYMIRATVDGITTNYYYDGQGKRIKKDVMGVVTIFIYDGMGRLALEYEADPIIDISQPTKEYVYGVAGMQVVIEPQETDPNKRFQYMTADHLSSPRVITDAAGNVISRRDFYPFGEDIDSSIGARSNIIGFNITDNIHQKFTGYFKDTETGLDFAQARYFASMQGRFLSPDSLGGSLTNPQTLNKYTYCQNDPVNLNDPTGLTSFKPIIISDPNPISYDSKTLFAQDPQKGNLFSATIDDFNKYISNLEKDVMDYFNKPPKPTQIDEGQNPTGNTLNTTNKAAQGIQAGLQPLMVLDVTGLGGVLQTAAEYQMGKASKVDLAFAIGSLGLGTESNVEKTIVKEVSIRPGLNKLAGIAGKVFKIKNPEEEEFALKAIKLGASVFRSNQTKNIGDFVVVYKGQIFAVEIGLGAKTKKQLRGVANIFQNETVQKVTGNAKDALKQIFK